MKKVLILYSNTGAGHLRAAQAIKEQIESSSKDVQVIMFDGLEKLRFGINANPSYGYALLSTKLQSFYNILYLLTNNRLGSDILRLLARKAIGRNVKNLIERENPDVVVSTHSLISRSTTKKIEKNIPFLTVVTDLKNPHQVWFDKNADKIITPTKALAELAVSLSKKMTSAVYIGYPLKPIFIKNANAIKHKIYKQLLILGGGVGAGNIKAQISSLLENTQLKFFVVCGHNKELFDDLSKQYSDNTRIQIYGFVHNLFELYVKSDIILTKAGPGTILEAAVMKKPLIITGWIGIQEKQNIEFVVDNNLGLYQPNPKKLVDAVSNIYKNYQKYTQNQLNFAQGTEKIAKYILDFI